MAAAVLAVRALVELAPVGNRLEEGSLSVTVAWLMRVGRHLLNLLGTQSRLTSEHLDRLLMHAGEGRIGARDLLAVKLAIAALGLLFGLGATWLGVGRAGTLLSIVAPLGGFFAPDLWLKRRAAARQRRLAADLPDLLDLLRVTVEAGLPLQRALAVTARRFTGPLAEEFRRAAVEQQLGLSHRLAMEGLARRAAIPEVRAFVAAVERSRLRGVPLGETLQRQARAAREARLLRVKEQAAKAGPKIQLIVAVVLVPAVLLLFAAAMLARILGGAISGAVIG